MMRRLSVALSLVSLAGCAASGAAGPSPEEEQQITSAFRTGEVPVIRVQTEDELVDQLTILLEDTYYREPQFRAAYDQYLADGGQPPVVLVGGASQAACVAASQAAGAAAGAAAAELLVDSCRIVSMRFAGWSPWGWAVGIVCTAIDRTDLDRAVGRAVGRALGGALAQCAATPDVVIGDEDAPVIAVPGEVEAPPQEQEQTEDRSRAHPRVQGCTVAQVEELCSQGSSGQQQVTELYHDDYACGGRDHPGRLYQFTDCDSALEGIFGNVDGMLFDQYCDNAAEVAERAARCQAGREIGGYGCFESPDARHQEPIDRAQQLNESCREMLEYRCERDSNEPRFSPSGHTGFYCAVPTG